MDRLPDPKDQSVLVFLRLLATVVSTSGDRPLSNRNLLHEMNKLASQMESQRPQAYPSFPTAELVSLLKAFEEIVGDVEELS